MEDEAMGLASPENSTMKSSEIAPLQLESHNTLDKPLRGMQDGLKVIIMASICFAISVTIALILTIYLAPPQVPPHAAVVSDSKLCANIGERLLRRGGSAVDAAIAVALCEGLVNPHHSGIGGGGFMIVRRSKANMTHVIDFMDSAPAALTTIMDKTSGSGLFVGVPGMLRGLELAHQKFGKLRWMDVVMAVVEIAYSPVNISQKLGEYVKSSGFPLVTEYFTNISQSMPEDKMNLTKLGWLLQTVAKEGADAFYNSLIADEIVSTISLSGGIMTKEDLRQYKALERKPVRSTFNKMAVESIPAPGSGPLLHLFLNVMENLTAEEMAQWNSTDLYHLIVEALKFTYGHQSLLGDTANARDNISSILVSKSYASYLASLVDWEHTHSERDYYLPRQKEFRPHGTSQVSVIDSDDDLVSLTVSLNGIFGSGLVTESGIILNSHMLNFDTDKMSENSIDAGKRPLSSMSPTIIYNPNRPCGRRLALGSANGKSLLAGLAEVIINIIGHGLPLDPAVNSPRLDVFLLTAEDGDEIQYEKAISAEILQRLKDKQHEHFNMTNSISTVHVVAKINETIYAKADPRSGGEAVIY